MPKKQPQASDAISTATLVWAVFLAMSAVLFVIGTWGNASILVLLSSLIGFVSLAGVLICFIAQDRRRERARAVHNAKILAARKAAEDQRRAEEEAQRKADAELRRKEWEEWKKHHDIMIFPVKGVTYKNDDKSSRQKHLAAVKDAQDIGEPIDIEFVEYEFEGAAAYRIEIDGIGIGNVPAREVNHFAEILPRIENVKINIETFVPDDHPHKIYRADVIVTYKI